MKKKYYYNEHDDNQVKALAKKRRQQRRQKLLRRLSLVLVVILVAGFFLTPFSRVQSIKITGTHFLDDKAVLKAAGVSKNSVHALTYPQYIEKNVRKLALVKDVRVHRGFFYGITIAVTESPVLAYRVNGEQLSVVDEQGKLIDIAMENLDEVQAYPQLLAFEDEDFLNDFCAQLAKIPEAVIALMSDISYSPVDPYDLDRVTIRMNDGKIVYVRLKDMATEMKYYQEILSQEPNACSYDLYEDKVYASPCP